LFDICCTNPSKKLRLLVQSAAPFFIPLFVFPFGRHALLEARFGYSTFYYFTWKFDRSASHEILSVLLFISFCSSSSPQDPLEQYREQKLQPFIILVSNYITYDYMFPHCTSISADRISHCSTLRHIISLNTFPYLHLLLQNVSL